MLKPLPRYPVRERVLYTAVLMAGILVPQAILYGPSLVGHKVLLPVDLLARTYLPQTPEVQRIAIHDQVLTDQIFVY